MNERLLEEVSLNTWPALQTILYDGWVIRLSRGYTRRANSVTPLDPSSAPLDEKISYCEETYDRHGLPCFFKLTPASEPRLDELLAARGYSFETLTSVQTARLDRAYTGVQDEPLSDEWLYAFFELNSMDPRHFGAEQEMQQVNPFLKSHLAIREDGHIVALGMAVLDRSWIGLFNVAVHADWRRRGLGRRITEGLMAWGKSRGATDAYLQVVCENTAALRLYEQLGFAENYRYWYRRAPN